MKEPARLYRDRQVAPQLYDQLREMILSLALPPGTPLVRTELAARYGVSQTPVRDALMRLEEEHLVDVLPQAGTRVSRIDPAEAERAQFLRRGIELELVRQLAVAQDMQLVQRLRASLTQQQSHLEHQDLVGFMAADQAFHRELYAAANMQDLWQLVDSRSGHIIRLRRLHLPTGDKAGRILVDHSCIVQAIEAGDAAGAQQCLRDHLSGTLAQIQDVRRRHPDFFVS